jgi:hypothetical protein
MCLDVERVNQKQSIPSEWVKRLIAFKAYASADELAKSHPPPHKMKSDGMEIWHYPLGVLAGTLYAIHVAVSSDGVPVAYMHMEPSAGPDTVKPSRPWWRLW